MTLPTSAAALARIAGDDGVGALDEVALDAGR
jgi:hypothetical protein